MITISVLAYASTVLDCLDGMWARKSGKTSKIGEFLDHYLDTIHIMILTGTVAVIFDFPAWMLAANMLLISTAYHIEILVLYDTKKFTTVAGVEGQLFLSACVLLRAFAMILNISDPVSYTMSVVVSGIGSIGALVEIRKLCYKFSVIDDERMLHFIAHHFVLICIYLSGNIDRFSFIIAFSFLNLAQTGPFVGSHVLNVVHNHQNVILSRWFFVLGLKCIVESGEIWRNFWIWLPIIYLSGYSVRFLFDTIRKLGASEREREREKR